MPLNIQENEDQQIEGTTTPRPIFHQPVEQSPTKKKLIIALFVIAVVASGTFLVYIFTSVSNKKAPSPELVVEQAPGSGTSPQQIPSQLEASKPAQNPSTQDATPPVKFVPAQKEASSTKSGAQQGQVGRYTIYVGSMLAQEPAQEEVRRWNEAGYEASVVATSAHYRIALGRFATIADAQEQAKQLSEAFEYGYWIGLLE